jgi:nucleoid DNA-binding protein
MNKTELVAAMADAAGLSKKDAEKALKAFTDVVAEELRKGSVSWIRYIRSIQESSKRRKKSSDR